MASSADGMTSRWSGTQLAVGVLGRHRRCCVELDTRAGILRLLAENAAATPKGVAPGAKGVGAKPWIRLGNRRTTTVLHECWVEDMCKEAASKARKSKPDVNSVHLSFPQHSRQLPAAAPRQKGNNRGGGGETGGEQANCKPRWQGTERAEPVLIRVAMDGGRELEEAVCTQINGAASQFARRRAVLSRRLGTLLELKQTAFDPAQPRHTQQLEIVWQLTMGDHVSTPPTTNLPPSHAGDSATRALDWGDLGFQNRFCPQSDFRDMGMLAPYLLEYYARHYAGEVTSLVAASRERHESYPFAAACINVGHLLVKLLLEGLEDPALHAQSTGHGVGDGAVSWAALLGELRSPLFLVLSRNMPEDWTDDEVGSVLEEAFCCAFGLLEQLWVRHGATYMMFNRVLAGVKECICSYIQDEWAQPSGSMAALREFDISRVHLSPDQMNAIAPQPRQRLAGPGANPERGQVNAVQGIAVFSAGTGTASIPGIEESTSKSPEGAVISGVPATVPHWATPPQLELAAERGSPSSLVSTGSTYGPVLESYEGKYDEEGRFDRYGSGPDRIILREASQAQQSLDLQENCRQSLSQEDDAASSDAETPPTSVDDDENGQDKASITRPWSPSGNMV